ncbi:ATP-dependent DNA helicase DinG [Bacillus sp. 2205SS5-2]|uniref:ATP-dependent DNA helicase DinG n=1 Tax=Bacillus sp. 2205SS5-2 TaxID=3109031 RepID=UPI003004D716
MKLKRMVVVDLETTGNSPKKGDKIIQLSAVIVEDGKIIDQYTTFLNPHTSIPLFIEELTGINEEMVQDAPVFADIAPKIREILADSVFVAHNVQFDLTFLLAELEQAGYPLFSGPTIDTVELAKIILPTSDSFKLTELSERFAYQHDQPHRADSDAIVTAELLLLFIKQINDFPLVTLRILEELASYLKSDIGMIMQATIRAKEKKVEELPQQLEIFRGLALRKRKKIIDVHPKQASTYPRTENEKREILRKLPGFESREGQVEMMNEVYNSFTHDRHCMIEAGTGIGKSIGYLLPAAYRAYETEEPVVISTHTIQLQTQLLHKELPNLERLLPFSLNIALLKGQSHYLNIYKFEQLLAEEDSQYDTVITKMQLLVWLLKTEHGDVDELNLSSGGRIFWNRLKHDNWSLSKTENPWLDRDFYAHAKQKAAVAHLIITNHSMLLTDVKTMGTILPKYQYLVLDEAHHVESVARRYLGSSVDFISVRFLMGQLGTLEQKQLFYKLDELIHRHALAVPYNPFELDSLIGESFENIHELFQLLGQTVLQFHRSKTNQKVTVSLEQTMRKPLIYAAERVYSSVGDVEKNLRMIVEQIVEAYKWLPHRDKVFIQECYAFLTQWNEFGMNVESMLLKPDNEDVVWLEGDVRSIPNSLELTLQPISVGPVLVQSLYSKKKSIVFTSATLTVKHSFAYFQQALGLTENVGTFRFPSPFAFKEKSKLLIPTDIPDIQSVSIEEYSESIAGHLIPIAEATKGRMLILFTSYEMLKLTYDLMKESGLLDDYILMAQGITGGSRQRLTKNFQRFEKAILFGTNSFWEGVDIPGDDLSCLVMVRLPFASPSEPVTKAKSKKLQQSGINSFSHYSLPEAVIRFKQGVGRLLRRSSDKGLILIFDRRILTARYGTEFLESIPDIPVSEVPLDGILDTINSWL